ncbi:MAG: hypothetical protein KC643_26570 [Nitrospira sp.]|nr:hypothetical protein [Nitrospira sp.]MCA9499608.1 hypothetical protein [Nitrospira sp.]
MAFVKVRQVTLAGERKALINESAIAYVQEISPDQDPMWQVATEPSRSLIHLHHRLDPIISFDTPEELAKQLQAKASDSQLVEPKMAKKSK